MNHPQIIDVSQSNLVEHDFPANPRLISCRYMSWVSPSLAVVDVHIPRRDGGRFSATKSVDGSGCTKNDASLGGGQGGQTMGATVVG